MIRQGDIVERIAPSGKVVPISRVEILNQWGLWWAVSIMVVGSIVTLAAKPEIFTSLFKSFGKKERDGSNNDLLKNIELPLMISYVGIPAFSMLGAWLNFSFFGVPMVLTFAPYH
jgi:hypothetical protein